MEEKITKITGHESIQKYIRVGTKGVQGVANLCELEKIPKIMQRLSVAGAKTTTLTEN